MKIAETVTVIETDLLVTLGHSRTDWIEAIQRKFVRFALRFLVLVNDSVSSLLPKVQTLDLEFSTLM
jgi:hypothetical protein